MSARSAALRGLGARFRCGGIDSGAVVMTLAANRTVIPTGPMRRGGGGSRERGDRHPGSRRDVRVIAEA